MNRDEAFELMTKWTESDSLRKHMLAVETAMRSYARRFGEDEEKWAVTGLLHDMDYEKHPTPDEHPMVGVREMERRGYPEDVLEAIKGHADYLGVPRETPMARTLYAVDELSGFVTACATGLGLSGTTGATGSERTSGAGGEPVSGCVFMIGASVST